MKIQYLDTARPGLEWMRNYYRQHPQLNRAKALATLKLAEQTLVEFPSAGQAFGDVDNIREYRLTDTAFSLLYTVANKTIWIIDVRDGRGLRSALPLRNYARELRDKHGIESL